MQCTIVKFIFHVILVFYNTSNFVILFDNFWRKKVRIVFCDELDLFFYVLVTKTLPIGTLRNKNTSRATITNKTIELLLRNELNYLITSSNQSLTIFCKEKNLIIRTLSTDIPRPNSLYRKTWFSFFHYFTTLFLSYPKLLGKLGPLPRDRIWDYEVRIPISNVTKWVQKNREKYIHAKKKKTLTTFQRYCDASNFFILKEQTLK